MNYREDVKSNSITVNTGLAELDILLNSKISIAQAKILSLNINVQRI